MSQGYPNQNPQYPNNYGTPGPMSPPPQSQGGGTMKVVLIVMGVLLAVMVLMCGVGLALLMPAIQAAREAARRQMDENSMKQVCLAMHNYESAYKRLPTPIVMNSRDEQVWSGIVTVLPYMEHSQLYNSIDQQAMKPWNDPSNAVLQGPAPEFLVSKRQDKVAGQSTDSNIFFIGEKNKANYNVPARPLLVAGRYSSFAETTDGTSNTIFSIMLTKRSAPWASPETTLSPDEAYKSLQQEDLGALVGLMDGSVTWLPKDINRATFDALVSCNGGEIVSLP